MRSLTLLAATVVLILAVSASAQQGHVSLYDDLAFSSCEFTVQPPGQVRMAYVVVDHAIPFTSLRFQVTPPACSGFTFLQLTPSALYIATGDLVNGFVVNGPCTTSPFDNHVATILYLTGVAPTPCCEWELAPWPHSSRGEVEIEGCDGYVGFAEAHKASLNGYCLCDIYDFALGPYRPSPLDGETDVNRILSLSWEQGCCDNMTLYLSTDPFTGFPADKIVYEGPTQHPYDPGLLLPNTTYYWRVVEWSNISPHGYDGQGRVWSFTTGEITVPAEPSTWGRVKALYQ
jgi:hypothetical protein